MTEGITWTKYMPKNFKTLAIIEKQTQDEMKIYNVLYLLME